MGQGGWEESWSELGQNGSPSPPRVGWGGVGGVGGVGAADAEMRVVVEVVWDPSLGWGRVSRLPAFRC